ncbi:MAG TPA: hypothetical protein VHT72_04790 [Puia sp.]|nr:hypothetical protein [Puia sp.]
MKSYNTVYYLLTVLLIMGGFASMAQNNYGISIISAVCMAFGLIFFIQFIQALRGNEPNKTEQAVEFFVLFVLAVIFTLRTLQIYFPFIEWIFVAAALVLALNYLTRLRHWFRQINLKNKMLAGLILIAYLSIVLFCIAMVEITFKPGIARWTGGLALILVFVFLLSGLFKRHYLIDGENKSAFSIIAGFKDRLYFLLSLFIIFSLYFGLSGAGILPKLYSNKFPQAYFEMVNNAETGKEKPVNGEFRYQEFKKKYDQFVDRNLKND